jgi:polysaccharide export outer membrane protein
MTIALALLLAAAQAQAPAVPPPTPKEPRPAGEVLPSGEVRPAGTSSAGYRIGPGDILRVTVYGHEDLSQTVVVPPAGSFVFPLIGPVAASEATPAEVENTITSRLAKGLIREPRVSVVVQEYRSKVVYVVGEVTRPGTYPLAGDTSVVEILSRAGPLSPEAGGEVVIVRPVAPVDRPLLPNEVASASNATRGNGTQGRAAEVLRVNVSDIVSGRLEENLLLRPNDTVFVPVAERIFVTGEVRNPGAFPWSAGLTLRQAVSLAGGFTEDASTGSARVVRAAAGGQTQTIKMKLDEPLRPGDTVLVKAKLF